MTRNWYSLASIAITTTRVARPRRTTVGVSYEKLVTTRMERRHIWICSSLLALPTWQQISIAKLFLNLKHFRRRKSGNIKAAAGKWRNGLVEECKPRKFAKSHAKNPRQSRKTVKFRFAKSGKAQMRKSLAHSHGKNCVMFRYICICSNSISIRGLVSQFSKVCCADSDSVRYRQRNF